MAAVCKLGQLILDYESAVKDLEKAARLRYNGWNQRYNIIRDYFESDEFKSTLQNRATLEFAASIFALSDLRAWLYAGKIQAKRKTTTDGESQRVDKKFGARWLQGLRIGCLHIQNTATRFATEIPHEVGEWVKKEHENFTHEFAATYLATVKERWRLREVENVPDEAVIYGHLFKQAGAVDTDEIFRIVQDAAKTIPTDQGLCSEPLEELPELPKDPEPTIKEGIRRDGRKVVVIAYVQNIAHIHT
ncbi:hypothetical protein CDD83_1984 [Cordyceps sp. RAO-2017]|nr:hypothetical protein CDD83_1984 [Cordyceps sp. RAO-2017]